MNSLQARPHVEEAADKAGEAVQDAAHTVATNVEPAVKQATDFAQQKVCPHLNQHPHTVSGIDFILLRLSLWREVVGLMLLLYISDTDSRSS